jgi:hypothetical protein
VRSRNRERERGREREREREREPIVKCILLENYWSVFKIFMNRD